MSFSDDFVKTKKNRENKKDIFPFFDKKRDSKFITAVLISNLVQCEVKTDRKVGKFDNENYQKKRRLAGSLYST